MGQYLNLTDFNLLQAQAEDILARFREKYGFPKELPVPVEMIARALLGLRCEPRKLGRLGNRSVGALSIDDRVIYVDERCNRHQYLFTVAHESGHWVLHEGNHCSQLHFGNAQDIPLSHILRSTRARTKKEKARLREIEANRFAGALLIPSSFLSSEAENYEVIDATAIGELARAFDVSMEAMLYRVKDLSRYLAWSGPRIDWDSLYRLESTLTECWTTGKQTAYPGSLTPGSGGEVITSTSTTAQRGLRAPSVRKLVATQAFDFLIECTPRQHVGELLSPHALGSYDAHHGLSCNHDFGAYPTGKGEDLAKVLAIRYKRTQRRRQVVKGDHKEPFIVELAGTPNAGKNKLIKIISDYLEDVHGYKVRVIDEGVKSCHMDKCLGVDRLYKTVALTVIQLYEASLENPGDYDFVIFNRGLFDRLAFVHAAQMCDRISQEQERIHIDYLLSYAHLQDIAFLFLISPDESLQRETERGFVNELINERDKASKDKLREQRILNRNMLKQLNSSYLYIYRTYKESFDNQIYLFDFTDRSDASILEKACALADATLPRRSAQLLLPELFGVYYFNGNSSGNRNPVYRRCLSKSPAQLAAQLSFPWE
jgi:Zn-dependent peptidase ImmA (M78 family)